MNRIQKFKLRLPAWTKRQRIVAGCALGFLLLATVWMSWGPDKSPDQQSSYVEVKRSDFLVSIVEGGTLKAVHEVVIRSELEGTARIISIVPEGAMVRKEDLLVELDSSELRDRLGAHEVVLQNTRFAFVQAKENLAIQKSLVESNIKDGELKVEFAISDLGKYVEGDWPQLEKDTRANITIAQEELERGRDRLRWTTELQKKGYASKSEFEADGLTVKRKDIELAKAQEQLRLLTKYDYPKRKRALEVSVEQAQKELERLKQRSASQIAQVEASLTSQNATLALQEKRLADLQNQIKLTRIYAPQDGLVVYASSSNPGSGVLIEEGAVVRQKQEIIKLPDVSQMMIEVRVHESHVQKLATGLEALVMIDSLPGQQFKGVLRKIAVLPDSSSRFFNPNLKVYSTEVLIEDELPSLKPGVSGRAEIIITNLTDVLTIPIQAVTTVKGDQVCLVQDGNASKAVPVEVGLYSDRLIEIKSGLQAGDRVLLSTLSASDDIDLSGTIASNGPTNSTRKRAIPERSQAEHPKAKPDAALIQARSANTGLIAMTAGPAASTNLPVSKK